VIEKHLTAKRIKPTKENTNFCSLQKTNKIIEWINKYQIVNWVEYNGYFESYETILIQKYYISVILY